MATLITSPDAARTLVFQVNVKSCHELRLRREFRIRVELQEPTFLTTEGSNWNTFSRRRFCCGPKRLLRLARVPALDKNAGVGIIRHKALDHFAFAFWALQFFVSHG